VLKEGLKHRVNGHGGASRGTLRNLVDRARKGNLGPLLSGHAIPLPSADERKISILPILGVSRSS
jgi:hypothetical protein